MKGPPEKDLETIFYYPDGEFRNGTNNPPRKVVIEISPDKNVGDLNKQNYYITTDMTVAEFYNLIRRRIQLLPEEDVFCSINNVIPPPYATMGSVYRERIDNLAVYIAFFEDNMPAPSGSRK